MVSHNASGEPDVMFAVDDEFIWLSDIMDTSAVSEVGFFKNLFKKIQKAVLDTSQAIVKFLAPIIKPAVRIANNVAITLLGKSGAAAIGAKMLDMDEEVNNKGVYHARFNCWQQYFGYTDLYDVVFDSSTSMLNKKFPFDTNGDGYADYVFWAWKGDYLNLGAGAELGIYKKWNYSDDIWIVDKSNAMEMTLKLNYKGNTIIDWKPEQIQWWITGFNSNYQKKKREDLTATYTVTFNNLTMFYKFKDEYKSAYDKTWDFSNSLKCSYVF